MSNLIEIKYYYYGAIMRRTHTLARMRSGRRRRLGKGRLGSLPPLFVQTITPRFCRFLIRTGITGWSTVGSIFHFQMLNFSQVYCTNWWKQNPFREYITPQILKKKINEKTDATEKNPNASDKTNYRKLTSFTSLWSCFWKCWHSHCGSKTL